MAEDLRAAGYTVTGGHWQWPTRASTFSRERAAQPKAITALEWNKCPSIIESGTANPDLLWSRQSDSNRRSADYKFRWRSQSSRNASSASQWHWI